MNRVTLPREVAEAIEYFKAEGYDNRDVLGVIEEAPFDRDSVYHVCALHNYSLSNYDDLLRALVAGYDVEQTPEEELLAHCRMLKQDINANVATDFDYGMLRGIEHTLSKLGIKIEGVNA